MEEKNFVRIAVKNIKTEKEVKGYPVNNSEGEDITKFIWDKYNEDGYFNASMCISYFDGKIGNGLYFEVVECDENGN
jgi:hypothetical protein